MRTHVGTPSLPFPHTQSTPSWMEALGMFRGQGYGGYPFQIGIVASCSIIISTLALDTVSVHVCVFVAPFVCSRFACSAALPGGKMPWIQTDNFYQFERWPYQPGKGVFYTAMLIIIFNIFMTSWLLFIALAHKHFRLPVYGLKRPWPQHGPVSSVVFSVSSMQCHCHYNSVIQ